MPKENKNLIVALDIGTSKVACLVGELGADGMLSLLGMGSHESKGLKKGVVVNIEATVSAIQRALEEAELMADCKIAAAYVGIAGNHIRSFNSTGMVAVKDREVSALDVNRALDTARAVNIPTDQQILHVLRQEFIIDGQEDVREPIGMSGVRLEVKVHIVTGAVSAAQNIVKCVRRCGLEGSDLILQPLASSRAVLSEDEKDLGVCLLDIGGGTTDIAIFTHGAIRHTAVIPIAGDQITNDIAMALRTPTADAETIKIRHGVALRQLADPNAMIDVPGKMIGTGRHMVLDLGNVRDLAQVEINGRAVSISWHAPYRVDVTGFLKAGSNRIVVRVANLWVNRLIGDKQPGAKPFAYAPASTYRADSKLLPSGLIGPVRLTAMDPAD